MGIAITATDEHFFNQPSAHMCEGYCSCRVCVCLSVCYHLAASVFTPSTNGVDLDSCKDHPHGTNMCVHNVGFIDHEG